MTKEELIAKGLTEKQAKFVMTSLDGNFVTKTRFNEVNEEKNALKKTLVERDKQLEELQKSTGDVTALKDQITALQTQNAEQQKAHEAEMAQVRLDNAIETGLTAAGAKNAKAVKALLDVSKLKLGDDGKVSGLDEAIKAIQKSDAYLFTEKEQPKQQQQFKGFQPGATADGVKPGTEVDPAKMTYSEMVAYLEANPGAKI